MRDFRQFTSGNIRKLLEASGRRAFLDIFHHAAEGRPQQEFKVWPDDFHPVALRWTSRGFVDRGQSPL
jgi:hypothetical protein